MSEFMPEIEIIPTARIRAIAHHVGRMFLRPEVAPPFMSNHFRGAEEMLANTQPTLFDQFESD